MAWSALSTALIGELRTCREVLLRGTEEVSLERAGQNEERCEVGERILLYQDLSNWHLNGLIKCEIGFMLCYLLGDMLSL